MAHKGYTCSSRLHYLLSKLNFYAYLYLHLLYEQLLYTYRRNNIPGYLIF